MFVRKPYHGLHGIVIPEEAFLYGIFFVLLGCIGVIVTTFRKS